MSYLSFRRTLSALGLSGQGVDSIGKWMASESYLLDDPVSSQWSCPSLLLRLKTRLFLSACGSTLNVLLVRSEQGEETVESVPRAEEDDTVPGDEEDDDNDEETERLGRDVTSLSTSSSASASASSSLSVASTLLLVNEFMAFSNLRRCSKVRTHREHPVEQAA